MKHEFCKDFVGTNVGGGGRYDRAACRDMRQTCREQREVPRARRETQRETAFAARTLRKSTP